MITSLQFCESVKAKGFDFFTGVPDSTFKEVLRIIERDATITYVPAVREDVAVGLAVGAYLAGRRPMILMQNSGLGVCLNAFTSLALLYRTPMLVLIGWRGYQGRDEPEHLIMGECTLDLLRDINMPYEVLEVETVREGVNRAVATMEAKRTPTAIILRNGILG